MDTPPVRFAQREGRALAYQTWGAGSVEFLVLSEWPANADSVWEHPSHLRMWRLFGSLGRVTRFDRSGIGSSDPDPNSFADPAAWAEDALAVIDEVGAERVAVTAEGWATHAALLLAVRHPDRVNRLALMNGYARWLQADSQPTAASEQSLASVEAYVRLAVGYWCDHLGLRSRIHRRVLGVVRATSGRQPVRPSLRRWPRPPFGPM